MGKQNTSYNDNYYYLKTETKKDTFPKKGKTTKLLSFKGYFKQVTPSYFQIFSFINILYA